MTKQQKKAIKDIADILRASDCKKLMEGASAPEGFVIVDPKAVAGYMVGVGYGVTPPLKSILANGNGQKRGLSLQIRGQLPFRLWKIGG